MLSFIQNLKLDWWSIEKTASLDSSVLDQFFGTMVEPGYCMNPHLALINFCHKNVWRNSNALHKKKIKSFFANGIITSILFLILQDLKALCKFTYQLLKLVQWCKAATPWVKSGISVAVKRHFVFRYNLEGVCQGDTLQLFKLAVRLDYQSIVIKCYWIYCDKCTVSTRITHLAQAQKMLNTE